MPKKSLIAPDGASSAEHLALADKLLRLSQRQGGRKGGAPHLPSTADIAAIAADFLAVFFPETNGARGGTREHVAAVLTILQPRLEAAVFLGIHRRCPKAESADACQRKAKGIAARMLGGLVDVRALLLQDVQAALDADPAATGADEIIACYPGLYAIAIYRAANRLLREGAEIIPRMLTEYAKSRTGIDIHPGATIGSSFFIDHGTGIVVGETARIGNGVRMYQGVTLGALSIKRRGGMASHPEAAMQRHPTIEDDVIIYANATILGGQTIIGRGAVVGGNSWITYSVPPGIRVGVGA